MKVKTCRKESKEANYWLQLVLHNNPEMEYLISPLINEAQERIEKLSEFELGVEVGEIKGRNKFRVFGAKATYLAYGISAGLLFSQNTTEAILAAGAGVASYWLWNNLNTKDKETLNIINKTRLRRFK